MDQGWASRQAAEHLLEPIPLAPGAVGIRLSGKKVGEHSFPASCCWKHASQPSQAEAVVPPHTCPAHAGVNFDVERFVALSDPGLEGWNIADARPQVEIEMLSYCLRLQRRHHQDRPGDSPGTQHPGFV
jgi:hypothetical protein